MHRTQGNGDPIDERADFFFECRRWQGEPYRVEPHKAAALEWFALDALPDPVVPHERALLAALRAGGPPPVMTFGFAVPEPVGSGGPAPFGFAVPEPVGSGGPAPVGFAPAEPTGCDQPNRSG